MPLRKSRIGAEVKHMPVILIKDDNVMWEKTVVGISTPWWLFRAVFLIVGLHFNLLFSHFSHGGQEHRDLKISQLSRVPSSGYDSNTHYVYVENGSKNYQGHFSETGKDNKVVRAFVQPGSSRCPVVIWINICLSSLPIARLSTCSLSLKCQSVKPNFDLRILQWE